MASAQFVDTAFDVASEAPLPPQARLGLAALDVKNQQAARKGLNTAQTVLLGIAGTVASIIAIALLASAESPRVQDGRWYGGWSVLVLAALPLISMTIFVAMRNSACQGDVVGALADLAPGKVGRLAGKVQTAQQFV